MSKVIQERKFRKYKGSSTEHCDKCKREIGREEWHFARRKYEVLRKEASTSFRVPLTRTISETVFCVDCAPSDKIKRG